jgi:hypothetical protein
MKFRVQMCIFSLHIVVCILRPTFEFTDIVELKLMKISYFLFHMAFHIQKRKLACRTLYKP